MVNTGACGALDLGSIPSSRPMKIHRFFVTETLSGAELVLKDKSLVNQIGRVLRVRKGETIALCNGEGVDTRCVVMGINESEITLHVTETVPAWVPEKKITVYLAPIRKEHFEWALEKCTEIGASVFVPLLTERSERGVVKRERAEAVIREASEQCGRGTMPEYKEPVKLLNLPQVAFFALDKDGLSLVDHSLKDQEIRLLIGPEGGWTDKERAFFTERGIETFSLGPTTLRAETAAIVVCAKVL